MSNWFVQVDLGLFHSELLDRLRSELGLSTDEAIGKLVRLWNAVLLTRSGGAIGDRSDRWIEEAVDWRGAPGAFAAFIRLHHLEDGTVRGWVERYGKFDKKRDRDRRSQAARRERTRKQRDGTENRR